MSTSLGGDIMNGTLSFWPVDEMTAPPASEGECFHQKSELINIKFILVGICGTFVSVLSIMNNSLLIYLFASRQRFNGTYFYYMNYLAYNDLFMALSYILIMSVKVWYDYFDCLWLYRLFVSYMKPVFTISQVTTSSSAFLIVAASLERYFRHRPTSCCNSSFCTMPRLEQMGNCMKRHRTWVAVAAMGLGLIIRGTVYFEINIVSKENCTGFPKYYFGPSSLAVNYYYYSLWMFFARNAISVFLPFLVLLYCNFAIVVILLNKNNTMRERSTSTVRDPQPMSPARRGFIRFGSYMARQQAGNQTPKKVPVTHESSVYDMLRRQAAVDLLSATRVLVLVILSYLVANVLNVCLTVIEYVDPLIIFNKNGPPTNAYSIAVDIQSILYIAAGALRLLIFSLCNNGIRLEIRKIIVPHARKEKEAAARRQRAKSLWTEEFVRSWNDTCTRPEAGRHNETDSLLAISLDRAYRQGSSLPCESPNSLPCESGRHQLVLCKNGGATVSATTLVIANGNCADDDGRNEFCAILHGDVVVPFVDDGELFSAASF